MQKMRYIKNAAIKVNYVALHRTLGLTDLSMKVYDEAGELFSTVILTEVLGDGTGLDAGGAYKGNFTPDAKGQWRIRITSATNNDDVQKVFEVGNSDVDEVKTQLDTVEGKVDAVQSDVTSVKGTVETTDGKVDALQSDVTSVKGTVETTDGKVDTLQSDLTSVKGTVETSDGKLDLIQDKLDNIDDQISSGGYIMN
jgi:peptidoglycan hydrolase CwlO-like protein